MPLCVRNRGGLRDVGREGLKLVGPSASLLTFFFSLCSLYPRSRRRRRRTAAKQREFPRHPPPPPHFSLICIQSAQCLPHGFIPRRSCRHFDCGGTESRRNNKILMSRGRESQPLVCTKGSTKPQKWNECAINVHLSCAWRGSR